MTSFEWATLRDHEQVAICAMARAIEKGADTGKFPSCVALMAPCGSLVVCGPFLGVEGKAEGGNLKPESKLESSHGSSRPTD